MCREQQTDEQWIGVTNTNRVDGIGRCAGNEWPEKASSVHLNSSVENALLCTIRTKRENGQKNPCLGLKNAKAAGHVQVLPIFENPHVS